MDSRAHTTDTSSEISQEAFLAAIVESSDDAIVGKNLAGTIVSWNRAAQRIFGYSEAEAIGQSISLIIPESRRDEMKEILASIARGARVERYETRRVTKSGRVIDVALTVSPVLNEAGEVIGASKIARDITADKQARLELETKALQLQTLHDAASTLSLTLDPGEVFESMRTSVARIMECDAMIVSSYDKAANTLRPNFAWISGCVTDTSSAEVFPLTDDLESLEIEVIRHGKARLVRDIEDEVLKLQTFHPVHLGEDRRILAKPGDIAVRSMLLVPIQLGAETIGVVQVLSNVRDTYVQEDLKLLEGLVYQMAAAWKNAELYQRAKESEAHFRLFANAMPQIAWSLDANGTMDFLNEQYHEYTGVPDDADPATSWGEVVHPDDRRAAMEAYHGCVRSGKVWEQELRLRRRDGQYRWHLSRLVPIAESGRIVRWFATSTDIHEKKEAEELAEREGNALRASREQLRLLNMELEKRVQDRTSELIAANQEMEGFTYSVSHDLRAPLRSIMSSSMMLIEDFGRELPEEASTLLRRQAAAAKKLANLIDDLLQYSRIGRKTIDLHPVDLSVTACAIAEEISRRHPERKVDWHIQPNLETQGDPNLLAMLLQNLMDNAFKFTASRPVAKIEFGKEDEAFFVRDNGVGFEMQYAGKLFRPFERLHRESDYAGTGIGLANVKRVVERHGGRVWVEGVPDKGATFRFTLG